MTSKHSFSDNRAKAMLCITGAVATASTQDAVVKWLSGGYPVHEALFIRSVIALMVVSALVIQQGGWRSAFTPLWRQTFLRGIILCTAFLAYILSLAAMPISDSISIYFTMPFFVAALAGPLLGERVKAYRWIAIALGFFGVMVMIRPGSSVFEPAALLALYSAFAYGVGQMMGRKIPRTVAPVVQALHQNFVYLLVAAALALIFTFLPAEHFQHKSLVFLARPWVWPSVNDFALMACIGVLASFGTVLFSSAYRLAESNFVAPFEYSGMFWAVTYGYFIFGNVPNSYTIFGAAIVISAGLFMLAMDRTSSPKVAPIQ
jgi:drug/metabolite transporter (DMT)-like permease